MSEGDGAVPSDGNEANEEGGGTKVDFTQWKPAGSALSLTLAVLLSATLMAWDVALAQGALQVSLGDSPGLLVPFLAGALFSGLSGVIAVPLLKSLKAGQVVRSEGPQAHLAKTGTPTMGGAFLIPSGLLAAILCLHLFQPGLEAWASAFAVALLTAGCALLGFADDYMNVRKLCPPGSTNAGLPGRTKLAAQVAMGAIFALWLALSQDPSSLPAGVPKDGFLAPWIGALSLSFLFHPFAVFTVCAESNALNLTDGVDGLASGMAAASLCALAEVALLSGGAAASGVAVVCVAVAGAATGFLAHNSNKASCFMGDCGSLALGACLSGAALCTREILPLLVASIPFVAETLSVMAQVGYYRATKGQASDGVSGLRLFKMAPLHHHLELSGWPETLVVAFGYFSALVAGALALFLKVSLL